MVSIVSFVVSAVIRGTRYRRHGEACVLSLPREPPKLIAWRVGSAALCGLSLRPFCYGISSWRKQQIHRPRMASSLGCVFVEPHLVDLF